MSQRTIHRLSANLSWLIGERVARMALGLIVTGYISRYLATAGYGILTYALSITSLFTAVANLGIDGVVIRELIRAPADRDKILGTAWFLKVGGAFIAIGFVALSAILFASEDAPPGYMLIVSLLFLPQSFEILDVWFQKEIKSKYTVIAKTASAIGAALLRVALVQMQAPISAFCAAIVFEGALFAIGIIVVSYKNGLDIRAWRFSAPIARILLVAGWPLIIGGVLVAVYQRIEQIFVMEWLGPSNLGIYNAAGKITEMWTFLPGLLLPSLYPLLAQKKLDDSAEYQRRVQLVFDLLTACGLAIGIICALTAPLIIRVIYGPAFSGADVVLMVQAWTAPFILSGAVRAQFFVLENLTLYHSLSAALGIAANIACAIFLIPHLGVVGAALASLAGFFVSAILSSWLFQRLRPCARYQLRAMLILFRIPSALAEVRRFL